MNTINASITPMRVCRIFGIPALFTPYRVSRQTVHFGLYQYDILYRYAQYKKYNTAASSSLTGFSDHTAVSSYAVTPLQWAVAEKLVNGTAGKLMPTGNATRAQVAAILHRFVENVATTK